MIKNYPELLRRLEEVKGEHYDAIVIEGADGVGKGRILNLLQDILGVTPYRPDYNFWQVYDHRKRDRWKVSGFFWDVWSHFDMHGEKIMLFDRGVISGAVYNNDIHIARDYKKLIRGMKVYHILVTCDEESFRAFQFIRNPHISDEEIESLWKDCYEKTNLYKYAFSKSGVDWVEYVNKYDSTVADNLLKTCEGCGHYSYGCCRHPRINHEIPKNNPRCEYAEEKEVQDRDDSEVYSL